MSEVLARNRNETKLQFFINALTIQEEIYKLAMSEKYVPKKWRYMLGHDIGKSAANLVDFITFANSIYPQNWREKFIRYIFQLLSVAFCYILQNRLILMERCVEKVKVENIEKLIELIAHEIILLKGWIKSSKK
jgi:hypothetical protein